MYPSIRTIEKRLNVDRVKATAIRDVMTGMLDAESFPGVANWVRQCYNRPWKSELKMAAIDEIMETHGVEALGKINEYTPLYVYCNTGDSYKATVVYDYEKEQFFISSWGDLVENDPRLANND